MARSRSTSWLVGRISQTIKFALYAILFVALLTGIPGTLNVIATSRESPAIERVYSAFYEAALQKDGKKAFSLFSPAYRAAHSAQDFKVQFPLDLYADVKLEPDSRIEISVDGIHGKATLAPQGYHGEGGVAFSLVKADGAWFLEDAVIWER